MPAGRVGRFLQGLLAPLALDDRADRRLAGFVDRREARVVALAGSRRRQGSAWGDLALGARPQLLAGDRHAAAEQPITARQQAHGGGAQQPTPQASAADHVPSLPHPCHPLPLLETRSARRYSGGRQEN